MRPETDDELVQRIKRGDSKAFATVVRRYAPLVLGTARAILGVGTLDEDVAQETWMKALTRIDQLEDGQKLRSWLMAICRNQALSELRARRLMPTGEDLNAVVDPQSIEASADVLVASGQEREQFQRALQELSPNQRVALALFISDLSLEDIGREMGLKTNAVKAVLFRARESLRARLAAMNTGRGGAE